MWENLNTIENKDIPCDSQNLYLCSYYTQACLIVYCITHILHFHMLYAQHYAIYILLHSCFLKQLSDKEKIYIYAVFHTFALCFIMDLNYMRSHPHSLENIL